MNLVEDILPRHVLTSLTAHPQIFICHAGPQKAIVGYPLYEKLVERKCSVFFDRISLDSCATSCRGAILAATSSCPVAVVILSRALFEPQRTVLHDELRVIAGRWYEQNEQLKKNGSSRLSLVVIPVFYDISSKECRQRCIELLGDKFAPAFYDTDGYDWFSRPAMQSVDLLARFIVEKYEAVCRRPLLRVTLSSALVVSGSLLPIFLTWFGMVYWVFATVFLVCSVRWLAAVYPAFFIGPVLGSTPSLTWVVWILSIVVLDRVLWINSLTFITSFVLVSFGSTLLVCLDAIGRRSNPPPARVVDLLELS